jgi:YjjG family noncanonical pyrimidine nucleotidase
MKKHYPWLLFDADGTLFDYNLAEATALRKAFELLSLAFEDEYLDTYRTINHRLWQSLEKREITPDVLQIRRFELLLKILGLAGSPDQMSTSYVEQLGLCTDLIEGAYEVLQVLQRTSRIVIVTNGLQAVQRSRMARSKIRDFVSELIISEEVGAAKPQAAFFDAAFARLGHPAKSDVLIIGDSLSSDIQGGIGYGLDTCWYNPGVVPRPEQMGEITYEIQHLQELLDMLG